MTSEASKIVSELRNTFDSGKTLPLKYRLQQLEGLNRFLVEKEEIIIAALQKDLHKPKLEALVIEIGDVKAAISTAISNLDSWMVEKPSVPLINKADGCHIMHDPLGVVVIIGAWNYPIQLTLLPLVGAIAGGNCVVIKPSEVSQNTSKVLEDHIKSYLDPTCFNVFAGGVQETTELLEQRFDHIFYTGSTRVGKIVMMAAAKHLTPVTLELGGKSPCIVTGDVDVHITAARIAWGKFMNCGQTCIAPDYILVTDEKIVQPLVQALKSTLNKYYSENPSKSDDYGRIVTKTHLNRLKTLLDNSVNQPNSNLKIEFGGDVDEENLYFAPTVVTGVKDDSTPLMQEEIFGPILPIMVVNGGIDGAIKYINAHEKPLALYIFTQDHHASKQVLTRTSSGGACVNDTIMHISVPTLPFGGVGASGMGSYHGKATFDTFTHKKSVMHKEQNMEFINEKIRYPAYTEDKIKWLNRLLL